MNSILKPFKKLKGMNQQGQGLTEFILLLIVVVGIILGGVYQFNDAFKQFADNYFGEYLSCLLETGELPALSGELGPEGECNQSYASFNLADGRPKIQAGSGGGAPATSPSGSDSSSNNAGRASRRSDESASGSTGANSTGSIASGGTPAADSGGSNLFAANTNSRRRSNTGGAQAQKTKLYTGDTETTTGNLALGNNNENQKQKTRLSSGYYYDADPEKQQQERGLMAVSASANAEESSKNKDELTKIENKGPQSDQQLDDEEGFTFGKFIRYLLIIVILLAILLFFGSQALQISKSME